MRKALAVIFAGGMLLTSSMAFAQDGDVRSRFYDFDNMLIDGEFKSPDLMRTQARDNASFRRLLDLKEEFGHKITESAAERALQ